jgi:hypothetical protein
LLVFIAFMFVPTSSALAHSSITDTQSAHGYTATMGFFGDAAFANQKNVFQLYLLDPNEKGVDFSETSSVRIIKEGGAEVFSGTLEKEPYIGYLEYVFPESGTYTLVFTFRDSQTVLVEIPFSLNVYPDPNENNDGQTAAAGFAENAKGFHYWLVGLLILLVAGAGFFVLKR